MAKIELKLPQMGESVAEATVTSWLKEIGDTIEADEAILEIATDKVDSEVPSEVDGVLIEKFFEVDDVAKVGDVLAIIETDGDEDGNEEETLNHTQVEEVDEEAAEEAVASIQEDINTVKETVAAPVADFSTSEKFFSPLVKNIAKEENIGLEELEGIAGTGKDGRVTKDDILGYLEKRSGKPTISTETETKPETKEAPQAATNEEPVKTQPPQVVNKQQAATQATPVSVNGQDEIVEMTRMGKLIAHHMSQSVQTSAHVQSFIEVDVTNIWNWRNKVKHEFQNREGEKLTFTPIFMKIIAKTIKDFPLINISVDGDKIIKRKNINLGMAAALPDGNLIVPVIKNADQLNLVGMAKRVNDLAGRARENKLKPDEIQGGTYTVTNVGTFGSVMGTPIINQPQVAILALGAIRKVPAVIETPEGDFIGIRHKMFLSHSYDHRVVNGALGGQFIQRVAEYIEAWDPNKEI
ncbi:dihydrolipoamide acetyltransferase family protein [Galbibacter pacificus]|uniref:Dihydrolipoamide acetyltransferase component of pyruvate dehydrogenase complex n=1 Tax=Galbibacter pacificus TaxID=2996052 RepID=A0ABT6FV76_9FLAO|nr:dihydrolipoamide acetyltransferase family protein [Galbibacter pacificus]MDG3583906.1 dihydrolipoamide acetyltransferase family protein [Galbibacter pacificus]MDG3587176.1 dihydrolipoamide acetyltransferase family protein [Galbibacter pacificus]